MLKDHGNRYFLGTGGDPGTLDEGPPDPRIESAVLALGMHELADQALRGELDESSILGLLVSRGDRWAESMGAETNMWERFCIPSLRFRRWWAKRVGWAMYTIQYQESLLTLFRAMGVTRVHEVAAGRALMRPWFTSHGLPWLATDLHPVDASVDKMDALQAAQKALGTDAIFASWLPHGSDLPYQLAKIGRPLVLVTEGKGGCTGSDMLWQHRGEGYTIRWLSRRFHDLPQWFGLHDETALVLPEGYDTGPIADFLEVDDGR